MIICRACQYRLTPFFSLGNIPLVNSFLKEKDIPKEKKYDLSVGFCENCYLVQLTQTISPKKLFTDYIYLSGTSKLFVEHARKQADSLTKKLHLTKKSFILEIASNDGTQLQFYKEKGMKILGVDPAKNIAKIANKNKIPTIPEFFNYNFAKKLVKQNKKKADLIFGANVLAHVPNILDFAKGVKVILGEDGTAIFEFPYVKGLLENKFDIIYHEHVFYYSFLALKNLFTKADLVIYDVEQTPMQGGSLLIFVGHPQAHAITPNAKKIIQEELQQNYHKLETYKKMNLQVIQLKKQLTDLLRKLKNEKKHIVAYSAPAKGMILANYFGFGNNIFDFIVDKAKEKQGMYTPGTHMKVYPIEKILKEQPDYVVILCWNIADEVIQILKEYKQKGGKFIIPIPIIQML